MPDMPAMRTPVRQSAHSFIPQLPVLTARLVTFRCWDCGTEDRCQGCLLPATMWQLEQKAAAAAAARLGVEPGMAMTVAAAEARPASGRRGTRCTAMCWTRRLPGCRRRTLLWSCRGWRDAADAQCFLLRVELLPAAVCSKAAALAARAAFGTAALADKGWEAGMMP